ncbi:MAG: phenylalanine--tRNA ligase subunit alpha [bacterium]
MENKVQGILNDANNELANVNNLNDLQQLKSKYLGKKGPLAELLSNMKNLSVEEKKELGQVTTDLRNKLEGSFEEKKENINDMIINQKIENGKIDVTLPGKDIKKGGLHPLTQTTQEIEDLFISMGYTVATGPEVEDDYHNFELLNLPHDHPARDMQDSFYFDVNTLLRTHTSPVQARVMLEKKGQPIKIICPGKVYRRDADDATHSHQFMQCEGLVLGTDISFADLKGALLAFANQLFGEGRKIRLRPSYFPFTEPSVEVDVTCAKCNGAGCNMCKQTGYIEVLGAGMVNKNVLKMSGYDPEKIQGFAFGIGIDRVAILKNRIEDIRAFYTNDVRFLSQFKKMK